MNRLDSSPEPTRHPWHTVIADLDRFGRRLCTDIQLYNQIPQALSTPEGFKKLFLLHYCSTILTEYSFFLSNVKLHYVSKRQSMIDPRYSVLRPSILEEIIADAYIYAEFHNVALDLTDPVASLISIIQSALANPNEWPAFNTYAAEPHCHCNEITKVTSSFSARLDHDLKYLDVSRNMHESSQAWMLSVLASVFLPLSVATGLLSMQTRFSDLRLLLYDFCGTVVLVGTVLVVLFQALRVWVRGSERFRMWARSTAAGKRVKRVVGWG
jgi:hypothetical protein